MKQIYRILVPSDSWVAAILLGVLLFSVPVALNDITQRISYGVAGLIFIQIAAVLLIYRFWKHVAEVLPPNSDLDSVQKSRPFIISIAVCTPLLISWFTNGEVRAIINPRVYWTNELIDANANACQKTRLAVLRAAENVNTVEDKVNVGAATTDELLESINNLKFLARANRACLDSVNSRILIANSHLARIDN